MSKYILILLLMFVFISCEGHFIQTSIEEQSIEEIHNKSCSYCGYCFRPFRMSHEFSCLCNGKHNIKYKNFLITGYYEKNPNEQVTFIKKETISQTKCK